MLNCNSSACTEVVVLSAFFLINSYSPFREAPLFFLSFSSKAFHLNPLNNCLTLGPNQNFLFFVVSIVVLLLWFSLSNLFMFVLWKLDCYGTWLSMLNGLCSALRVLCFIMRLMVLLFAWSLICFVSIFILIFAKNGTHGKVKVFIVMKQNVIQWKI